MVKHKKCRKKFNYNKNRRRIRNKQKKPPHIGWLVDADIIVR